VYRVLLTGIHLLETGRVEADLRVLDEIFRLPYLVELMERKASEEHAVFRDDGEIAFHRAEFERLRDALEAAGRASRLPEAPTVRPALEDLLVRVRLKFGGDA
jgi:hypothetical protein